MRWAAPVSVAVHIALLVVMAGRADTPLLVAPPMMEVALLSPPAPEPEPALPATPPPEPVKTVQAPQPLPEPLPEAKPQDAPVVAMVRPRHKPHRPAPPEPASASEPDAPPAPQPVAEAPPAPPQQTAAVVAPPAPPRAAAGPPPSWLGEVMARLQRQKDYPHEARRSRREGVAMLRFSVNRDGRVLAWRLERSTGHPQLDGAVERMIERATLPPMPPEMDGQMADLVVPVRFALR